MTTTPTDSASAREAARRKNGEFGAQEHARPTNGLTPTFYEGDVEPLEVSGGKKGIWSVDDTVMEMQDTERGFTRMLLHTGGRPDWRARNKATERLYAEEIDLDDVRDRVVALAENSEKATLLRISKAGQAEAHEVTLTMGSDGEILYFHKGNRNSAYLLNEDSVLDVYPGYGHQQTLADGWAKAKTGVPELEKVHQIDGYDAIPEYEGGTEPPNEVAAVYMVDHPGFGDGPAHGCMFMATDIQKGDGPNGTHIVNGYFWAPKGSQLSPENGSMYTSDLARRGGKITDYKPNSMTFRDCMEMPRGLREGITRVMGS